MNSIKFDAELDLIFTLAFSVITRAQMWLLWTLRTPLRVKCT